MTYCQRHVLCCISCIITIEIASTLTLSWAFYCNYTDTLTVYQLLVFTKVVTIQFSQVSGMWMRKSLKTPGCWRMCLESQGRKWMLPKLGGDPCPWIINNLCVQHDTKHFETSKATWSSLWQSEIEIIVSRRKLWMLICDCYACIM